ncbi:hypothetical protein SERIO_v1c03340 [Spiroplasma eriocheiris]|uniref:HTH cro/C1-type domain-containing protein n=2 Tax=Spiroplasma eriocheiris TaxID=315358 RepID=A0A0H3XJB7_9MOLU|nr:helix-turn-helix transcriptional regulator [Spiroplasma eriocheiris]AHF57459.1 hypothetical protein SPE_0330 [Spiroplasma eriocheiris CCTCC M 207170]AKM53916.1 hypothetical protein SERIO_v1c03340 [Spiroplasma eriocheiris]
MNGVIKMLRIHRGWTQRELAQKTGVQQSTICRIEADCSSTSWNKILRILVALKVDINKFYQKIQRYNVAKIHDFLTYLINNSTVRLKIIKDPKLVAEKLIQMLLD